MDTTHTSYSASIRSLIVIRSVVIAGQSLLLWYLLDKEVEPLTLGGM